MERCPLSRVLSRGSFFPSELGQGHTVVNRYVEDWESRSANRHKENNSVCSSDAGDVLLLLRWSKFGATAPAVRSCVFAASAFEVPRVEPFLRRRLPGCLHR